MDGNEHSYIRFHCSFKDTLLNRSQLKPLNKVNPNTQVIKALIGCREEYPKAKSKNSLMALLMLPFAKDGSIIGNMINKATGTPTPTAIFPILFKR